MTTVCHQKIIKDRSMVNDSVADLFGNWWDKLKVNIKEAECRNIDHTQARNIIEKYEYLGTYCNAPIFAHGIFYNDHLAGCVVFGAPSPPNLARSVIKDNFKVIQLSRGACVHWSHKHSASKLIASGLNSAKEKGYDIVIAFSDPDAGEVGTVYQATNWLYCGLTAKRPDYFDCNGKRIVGHFKKGDVNKYTKGKRTQKHRYVFLLGSKKERKLLKQKLLWPVSEYPKRMRIA